MRALILSAGFGERLRPLTETRAKPAIDFLNIPMLTYPYHWLSTLGLTDLVFNTHYLSDTIRHAAMHVVAPEVRLHFSHENEILGSGGGIWQARFDLMQDAHFAVANGDGVILNPAPDFLCEMNAAHQHSGALATLLVCPLDGVGERIPGVWIYPDGKVAGFGKTAPTTETRCLHYASFMLFSDRIWPFLPEGSSNILYDVLEPRIRTGATVMVYEARDLKWFETGKIQEFLAATKFCLEQIRDQSSIGLCALDILFQHGPSFHLHSRLDQLQMIADSAQIEPGAQLEGFVVIGNNCRIEAEARISNSVILSGTTVTRGRVIRDSVIT